MLNITQALFLRKIANFEVLMENVIFTNMCMIYNGNNVVVQNRVDKKWSGVAFPGGHIEYGESFTDSVIREVYEETGLTISCPRLCGIDSWMCEDGSRYMILLYKTNKFSGELCSSNEGECFWTTIDEMKSMNLAYTMSDLLDVFLNEDLSELSWQLDKNKEWKYMLK